MQIADDNAITISTEHIVDSPEEAAADGASSAQFVAAFINGYGSTDTSAWQPQLDYGITLPRWSRTTRSVRNARGGS